jgi:putative FmdB family regulatory protein
MPRYGYQCPSCDAAFDVTCSWSDYRPEQACECGGLASRVFDTTFEVCVKGNQLPFKLDATCVPVGWEKGNTDADAVERAHAKMVASYKKRAKEVDKQAIKGGIRHIARVPRELARMRNKQFGKDYLDPSAQSAKELKDKLKADGQLFVN